MGVRAHLAAPDGAWLVAGVALAGIGLWGWRAWQGHVETMLMQANGQYQQVLAAFAKNDLPGAIKLADQLVATLPRTGYAEQGQLWSRACRWRTISCPRR